MRRNVQTFLTGIMKKIHWYPKTIGRFDQDLDSPPLFFVSVRNKSLVLLVGRLLLFQKKKKKYTNYILFKTQVLKFVTSFQYINIENISLFLSVI